MQVGESIITVMPLGSGTRLGNYETVVPLGIGGKGEVHGVKDQAGSRSIDQGPARHVPAASVSASAL